MKSKVVVCIQARTNSSRLPGKVLLPVAGLPLSVLAAKRAAYRSPYPVQVLISDENSDNLLASELDKHNVPYFRGNLNNVLKRFVDALSEEDDNTIVVRLTADNVFPNFEFIQSVVDCFERNQCNYICANGEHSGLPYGVSAEVMRVYHLRKAMLSTKDSFDIEHVTPFIRRRYGDNFYKSPTLESKFSRLRCTIDNLDDYLNVNRVFSECHDPISVSIDSLCDKLLRNFPVKESTHKLVLGAAQLGLEYGITNQTGKPDLYSASQLLSTAVRQGVNYIDTARAYGNSELVIGSWLKNGWQGRCKVITKLEPLEELKDTTSLELVKAAVTNSVSSSLIHLGLFQLDVLMLHRAEHLYKFDATILKTLEAYKESGTILRLGVSVQSPQELALALKHKSIDFIQLPYNILDHRWNNAITLIRQEKVNRNLTVHVRSVFLQGLLLSDSQELWARAHVDDAREIVTWLQSLVVKYEFSSVYELCISYVNSLDWVDGVVTGCENMGQLVGNIEAINLKTDKVELIQKIVPPFLLKECTLNPAKWA